MSVPKYEELMKPVLQILKDGSERKNNYIQNRIAEVCHLSEEDKAELLPSGKHATYKSRTNWAITYLINAGLIEKVARGNFTISELGIKVLNENPPKIDNNLLMR